MPINLRATFLVSRKTSAYKILLPYFILIRRSRQRALSRDILLGYELRGANLKSLLTLATAFSSIEYTVYAYTILYYSNEKTTIIAEISRLLLLRVGYQGIEILLKASIVEAFESLSIVKLAAKQVCSLGMLTEDVSTELVWLLVSIAYSATSNRYGLYRVLSYCACMFSLNQVRKKLRIIVCCR